MSTMLLRARRAAAERFSAVAVRYTPDDIEVSYRARLTGCAWAKSRRVCVPRPRTRRALHIYLHEIAHVVLEHVHDKPEYLQEYEAELWAFEVMHAEGIGIPRQAVQRAANYVQFLIHNAEKRGMIVDRAQVDLARFEELRLRCRSMAEAA